MTRLEILQKIAEAQNWLVCDCPICQAMRSATGTKTIENYIARLKAELIKS